MCRLPPNRFQPLCLLALAGWFAASPLPADDFRIDAFSVTDRTAVATFLADTNRYYILERSPAPGASWQPIALELPHQGLATLADLHAPATSAFYRVIGFPSASPGDSDGDGIDDLYEARYPLILNPFDPLDALEDSDWDGHTNLEEYRAGTDPTNPSDPDPTAGLRITALRPGAILDEVEFQSLAGNYYVLLAGPALTNLATPVDIGFGQPMRTSLHGPRQQTCFYRVRGVHNSSPLDTDGDGMDDVFELRHGLNALWDDASEDADGDGYSNLCEYLHGSDPTNAASIPAATRFVDAAAVPGGDGTATWPHRSLAAALAAAQPYDVIQVADGTYTGPANRALSCGGVPLVLVSAHGPDTCVIDGGLADRAFRFDSRDDSRVALIGFTICHGYGSRGGAIACDGASCAIINCRFEDNLADDAGGAVCATGGAPLLRACTFTGNSAWSGGALFFDDCPATLRDCTIAGNSAVAGGGGCCLGNSPVFDACTFSGNRADDGAALFCDHAAPQLLRCRLDGGVADSRGGALFCQSAAPVCASAVFSDNVAALAGGAVCAIAANPVLRNCTVTANLAPVGGGLYGDPASAPWLCNTILWGNRSDQVSGGSSIALFSDIEGGCAAAGLPDASSAHNLALDPLLATGQRLQAASPCIDAGTDVDAPAIDMDGQGRWDDPGHSNVVSIVDIGACEFVDSDGDGLPDAWEWQVFGGLGQSGAADNDGDGFSNAAEFIAGTDPAVSNSAAAFYLAQHPQPALVLADATTDAGATNLIVCGDITTCRRVYACLDSGLNAGVVTLRRSNNRINLWGAGGSRAILQGGTSARTWDLADAAQRADFRALQDDLWLQGVSGGAASLTLTYAPAPGMSVSAVLNVFALAADVTNIRFNFTTASATNDALNIRSNQTVAYTVDKGEWTRSGTSLPACYCVGARAAIRVRLTLQSAVYTSAVISATSMEGSGLPGVAPTRVAFTNGISSPEYVDLPLDAAMPPAVGVMRGTWQWRFADFNGAGTAPIGVSTSGVHTVYTVLAPPAAPWTNSVSSRQAAWSVVLEKACTWAAGASNADQVVTRLVPRAYSGFGKAYDGSQSHSFGATCHLTAMLADSVVDCQDMSAIVQLYAAVLGVPNVQTRRVWGVFWFQPLRAIGSSEWVGGAWNFHQFGWYDAAVYDACVNLRQSDPYQPLHDDLDGRYHDNLYDSGVWAPADPAAYNAFD